jgi:hypothetical protein
MGRLLAQTSVEDAAGAADFLARFTMVAGNVGLGGLTGQFAIYNGMTCVQATCPENRVTVVGYKPTEADDRSWLTDLGFEPGLSTDAIPVIEFKRG